MKVFEVLITFQSEREREEYSLRLENDDEKVSWIFTFHSLHTSLSLSGSTCFIIKGAGLRHSNYDDGDRFDRKILDILRLFPYSELICQNLFPNPLALETPVMKCSRNIYRSKHN